ncbi:MAG: hypothetical protein FWG34_04810 [Oscillospiraceae bacterium]|nr:hypothetical protein [Oscillospiraceae bacterium]
MKLAKKLSAVILAAFMIVSLLSAASIFNVGAAADSKPEPSGAYLKFTVDINKPEGENLAYDFKDFKKIGYTVEDGDMIEYDVWCSSEFEGFGAVDANGVTNVGSNNLRDIAGLEDQNSVGMHTGRDMSEYAYDRWYHRVIDLSVDDLIGQTIDWFQIACHPGNDTENLEYQAYVLYDNIVITNNGAIKLVIFKDEGDWDGNTRQSHNKDCKGTLEMLTFTQAELDGFAAAEEAKAAEEASREASREAAKAEAEASREQASIEASIKQSEEEAAAAAEKAGDDAENGDAPAKNAGDSEEGSNLVLILCIAGGGLALIVVIILIAVGGGKKKKKEN